MIDMIGKIEVTGCYNDHITTRSFIDKDEFEEYKRKQNKIHRKNMWMRNSYKHFNPRKRG